MGGSRDVRGGWSYATFRGASLAYRRLAGFWALAVCLGLSEVHAQGIRPGDQRLEVGESQSPAEADLELPRVLDPGVGGFPRLSDGLRVPVSRIQVEGVTAFSPERIHELVAVYEGRTLDSADLISLRDALTALYVEHGYLTSGALVPDQEVQDGSIRIQVVEGRLGEIEVEGADWFGRDYFTKRLRRAGQTPVNVHALEAQLQVFQRNPRLRAVHGRLLPGEARGVSRFLLRIEEARPYELTIGYANDTPPSIGGDEGNANVGIWNLLGRGDEIFAAFRGGEGLRDYRGTFSIPINSYDTRIGIHGRYTRGLVVEPPFDVLDVKSKASTYGFRIEQPFFFGSAHQLQLGLIGELREQESKVSGVSFCTIQGARDCDVKISVLRPVAEWVWRSRRDAVALRSMLSFGIHAFGATRNPSHATLPQVGRIRVPDGRFTAWLAQLEWVHGFARRWWGGQLVVRSAVQLSSAPLLSIEKLAVGGRQTVRGYRENLLVRDNGLLASVELRIPLARSLRGRPVLELAPFFDFGRAWDHSGSPLPADSLASLGLGVRVSPTPGIQASLYWGGRLLHAAQQASGLQGDGISVQVRIETFAGLVDAWPPEGARVIWWPRRRD